MCNAIRSLSALVIGSVLAAGCVGNDAPELLPSESSPPDQNRATQPPAEAGKTPSENLGPTAQPTQHSGDCPQLVVENPAVSMEGVTLYQPSDKLGRPEAGDPSYIYLAAGKDAVILPGPIVTNTDGLSSPSSPSITMVGARSSSADGYDVVVNSSLQYHVAIDDFEFEVALARVELCDQSGDLRSMFVFKGNRGAGGVAHQVTISARTTAKVISMPSPVSIEVR